MKKICIIILGLIVVNCSSPTKPKPPAEPTVDELVADAWVDFAEDDYVNALTVFSEVLAEQPDHGLAQTGMGWCLLMRSDFDSSMHYFDLVDANKTWRPGSDIWKLEAQCGQVVAQFYQRSFLQVVNKVDSIFKINTKYTFKYNTQIDWRDLVILKAQSLFFLKNYSEAWSSIRSLAREYDIDPDAKETWTIDGEHYFSFESALSKVIELMSKKYGSRL